MIYIILIFENVVYRMFINIFSETFSKLNISFYSYLAGSSTSPKLCSGLLRDKEIGFVKRSSVSPLDVTRGITFSFNDTLGCSWWLMLYGLM